MLAVITVNSALDNTIGEDELITLREAINDSNATIAHDTITFDPAVFNTPTTINLTAAAGGELTITQSVTIDASMLSNGITIKAFDPTPTQKNGDGRRIFNIPGFGSNLITLKRLTLTGGDVGSDGGAIRSTNSLALSECVITGNRAAVKGGGPRSADLAMAA